jgi:HK97 family phage prohead protease
MPYEMKTGIAGCDGFAVVKVGEDTPVEGGCHDNQSDALDHVAALNIATSNERSLEQRAVDLTPARYMIANCKRGLKYHEEGESGDGLRPRTVREARDIASGKPLSEDKVKRMRAWIARHLVDLDNAPNPNDPEYPSAGQVAHLLWASGTTREQAQKTYDWCDAKMKQIEAESTRALPPSYRPSTSADVPVMRPSCQTCEYFDNARSFCMKWLDGCDPAGYCDAWEKKDDYEEDEMEDSMEDETEDEMEVEEDQMPVTAWVSRNLDEKRSLAFTNLECRAIGEGNTLVGYAAMFDLPSHDLGGFTEYVARGAFAKTLNDGADVRLLIDHEGAPLARTKSNKMRLMEDERGLRVEAELDPANPRAAEIISALKRGDMNQMSFAFRVIKDEWSRDRSTRTLKEVRLFDVSVVTFPAYEDTVAEIRKAQMLDTTPPATGRLNLRKRQIQLAQLLK